MHYFQWRNGEIFPITNHRCRPIPGILRKTLNMSSTAAEDIFNRISDETMNSDICMHSLMSRHAASGTVLAYALPMHGLSPVDGLR